MLAIVVADTLLHLREIRQFLTQYWPLFVIHCHLLLSTGCNHLTWHAKMMTSLFEKFQGKPIVWVGSGVGWGANPQLGGAPGSIPWLAAVGTQYCSTNLGMKTMQGWWSAQFLRLQFFCMGN